MFPEYDVIVVGGGHAGCEAAAAAANLGSKVLLATMNMQTIGQMSCNPAMGGVAKGQIVREIDALGGYSGIVTDHTMIQFRMLNRSKGAAMWSPRAQCDRMMFATKWRDMLEKTPNVDFWQEMIVGILVEGNRITGVKTSLGIEVKAKSVVLTNGTFLNGLIHIGERQMGGGRAGERAAVGLTADLIKLGFETGRMKTGTPPRIDGRSLDYSKMEAQYGDENHDKFSYTDTPSLTEQRCCWITYTNNQVHDTLKTGFDKSPMFNGRIRGVGPRYCPSIEDKINRFSERNRHQIFVEPEGWNTVEIYVNGFSTSLPEEVQYKALRQITGFENAKMFRPGYAIEYDYFPPIQLKHSLETKLVENLFFAGQINGTTGYEEAACQGLMAGINAHRKIQEEDAFVLSRSDAYIGVLIDDLINKGTEEPYRMFTSRAEYRILLRQDNADVRLSAIGHEMGLVNKERLERVEKKVADAGKIKEFFHVESITPKEVNTLLEEKGTSPLRQKGKMIKVLLRPQIEVEDLRTIPRVDNFLTQFENDATNHMYIEAKYESYMKKEKEMAAKMKRLEQVKMRPDFNYAQIIALSSEAREKLSQIKPATLGQASRISGVSPADISVLMIHLSR